MEKRTREILALVLLVVLGLAVAGGMAWYILVGHNWNQAATHIDDMVGSMDGYTVVVFDGTVKKPKAEARSGSSPVFGQPAVKEAPKKIKAKDVAQRYREKGAAVVLLDSDSMQRFSEPSILKRGDKRIGVFSFASQYRGHYPELRADIRYLQTYAVDFTIGVSKSKKLLKGQLDGIDLLVVRRDVGLPEGGEFRRSTFCVDSPYKGEVQAVIMSPSGVMSSRTIRDL